MKANNKGQFDEPTLPVVTIQNEPAPNSNMKLSKALLYLVGGVVAIQGAFASSSDEPLGTLKGCFLRDIKAYRESRDIVEEKLSSSNDNVFEYVPSSSQHSIRCDVEGAVDQVDFILQPDGETHKTWGEPFWISGSRGDWVRR